MKTLTKDSPIVADAHSLYIAFGGRQHRRIEAAMRAKGWTRFSRRVFHDRQERGSIRLGWIRRFRWNVIGSEPPAIVGGMTRLRTADAPVRNAVASTAYKREISPRSEESSEDTPVLNAVASTAYNREISPRSEERSEDTPVRNAVASTAYNREISSRSEERSEDTPVRNAVASTAYNREISPRSDARSVLAPVERRRMEIKSFKNWLKRVNPGMHWDWPHLRYLYGKLADVTTGKTKRLMIFMPPRHGKSELVTVRYAAWRLRQDASLNIIVGSYNQKLANRFSRKIRITWEDSNARDTQLQGGNSTAETPSRGENEETGIEGINEDTIKPTPALSRSSPSSLLNQSQSPGDSALNGSRNRLNTVAEWETGMGGGVRAVGVGSGVTGYGGKLIIIDDPIKSRTEAESETYRNRTWEWFNDDLYTRLEPGAAIILIQTRWHEDDLAGRLLQEMKNGGEKWEVVSLPAIAESEPPAVAGGLTSNEFKHDVQDEHDKENKNHPKQIENGHLTADNGNQSKQMENGQLKTDDQAAPKAEEETVHRPLSIVHCVDPIGRQPGDALCPERFPVEELDRIRRQLGEYSFSALYQQRPMPLEGGLFKKKWFTRFVERAPQGLRWIRGYDLTIYLKTSADFTASARCALDTNGDLYISDVLRARLEYPDQRKFVVDRLVNERDTEHCIEDALHAKAFVQDLRREPQLARHVLRLVRVTSDKLTRALAWANRAEEGKVVLVRGPWLNQFLDEVCSFPNGAHDDQVDAVSLAIQMMDRRKRQFFRF